MGSNMRNIQRKVEKLGKKIADKGTYKSWTSGSNHPEDKPHTENVRWEYK
tara:strand:- start:85 stop:234 length:150 start_codon:yes stop_codon:yes gene_type:complete